MHRLRRRPPRQTNKDIQVSLLGSNILVMGVSKHGKAWLESRFKNRIVEVSVKDWVELAQSICDSGLAYQDVQRSA